MAANIFILAQVPSSTDLPALGALSDAIGIGKPASDGLEILSTVGSGKCTTYFDGAAWVASPLFPVDGQSYFGKNLVVTDGSLTGDKQIAVHAVGQKPPSGSKLSNFVAINGNGVPATQACTNGGDAYFTRYSVDCDKCS